jgi:Tol biopolymer transport system component
MRGLVFVLIVLLAFACNGGEEGPRTATPAPSPSGTATATVVASSTPTPETTAAPEIAYVRAGTADVWLMAADGSGKRNLTQGGCPYGSRLYWSPQGDRIACISSVAVPQVETRLLIFDLDGQITLSLQHAGYFFGWPPSLWSPSGQRLAYGVQEDAPRSEGAEQRPPETPVLMVVDAAQGTLRSIPGGEWPQWSSDADRLAYHQAVDDALVVYDPASGQEETLANGLRPLGWVLGGKKLLVAANYQEQEEGATYEANLLDPATGQMTRTPDLDNTDFWLSPDEDTVAFHALGARARDYRLAMLNLSSLQLSPIAGSSIGYGSDFIPQDSLAFSRDGSDIYWVDRTDAPETIYKANRDGSGLVKLLEPPGWFGGFSPDLRSILYYVYHRPEDANKLPNGLWASNIDGSDARFLAEQEQVSWAAWRPTP